MSTISASTLITTALQYTADTTGTLVFKTGATPTTALTLNADQSATFAGTVNFATAGFTNLSYTGTFTGGTGVIAIGTNQIYKDAAGNVGIGMTPTYQLDITTGAGNGIRVNASTGQANIYMQQAGVTNGYINAAGGGGTDLGIYANRYLTLRGTDALIFYCNQTSERMRIDSAGNVGIGTSTQTAKLEVSFNTSLPSLSSSSGAALSLVGSSSERLNFGNYAAANYGSWIQTSNNAGSSYPISLNPLGGNVGIGIQNPANALQVFSGSSGIAAFTGNNANNFISVSDNNGVTNATFGSIGGGNGYVFSSGYFATYAGGLERMRMSTIGNLLIGTSTESLSSTAVKILATSTSNTAIQFNTSTSGGCAYTNNAGAGIQIFAYTGAIGSESFIRVLQNSGTATTIALQNANSVSGIGITFPATQTASTDANTLDDYEEGTWTPTFASTGATITNAGDTSASYTKIGNIVNASAYLHISSVSGTTSNAVLIAGLPFASKNGYAFSGSFGVEQFSVRPTLFIDNTTRTTANIYQAGTISNLLASNLNATGYYLFTITYQTA